MNNYGTIVDFFRLFQRPDEHRNIVAVNVTDVLEPKFVY